MDYYRIPLPEGQEAGVVVEDAATVEQRRREAGNVLEPRLELTQERALKGLR